ncbi:MAG: YlbF family regulator [Clostridiales bacterium]|nr:YlbF family regulator [Clostridiales bacterium]
MTYDTAKKLAQELKDSEEYKEFRASSEKVKENETTVALLKDYHKLQIEVQSMAYTGKKDDEKIEQLKKVGELLQMNREASDYLIAEFRLNRVVSDIYKIIAEAIELDLSMLEA